MKRLSALLWALAISGSVGAAGPLTPGEDKQSTLDFSLRFARHRMPLDYAERSQDNTIRWAGISLREKASRRITLGMFGGYAFLTQTNNPLTAGKELEGYHAGFSLHAVLLEGRQTTVFGALEYIYQKVDHSGDGQTIVIDWSQPQAQFGAIFALAPRWRLYGGGIVGRIDGEERASGTINHTLSFERGTRTGGFAGIDLNVETDGYIGIEARSGLARGVEIYFKRKY